MSVIRTEDLGKTYKGGTAALRGLNLTVNEAEVFGFLGPNGAGKSTTIQLLLNFLRPSTGKAYLFDQPVSCPETRSRLGYLPESVNLHSYYSGHRLLELYGGPLGIRRGRCSNVSACWRQAGKQSPPTPRACCSAWDWRRRCSTIPIC